MRLNQWNTLTHSQHTPEILHSFMPGNHFFNNLVMFCKLPLCQDCSHRTRASFCICKSLALCSYRSCAWILMLCKPRYETSVHLYCMYLFFPSWKPHSGSSAGMKTPTWTPPPQPPQRSFTSSHLAFPKFPEKVTFSANNNVQGKILDFVLPSTSS